MKSAETKTNGAAPAAPQKPTKSLTPLWTPPDRPSPLKPRRLLRRPRRKRTRRSVPPLRFTPTAWAKLVYLRDAGSTEIGGFGITPSDDLLLVEDIQMVRQVCTVTSVQFDDASVAELFDHQVDQGLRPEQFARIWIHTHPGQSAAPSSVDETTFRNVFGRCDWALMFVLVKGGATFARLQFRAGPGGTLRLPVGIEWRQRFAGTDEQAWQTEYDLCVQLHADTFWPVPPDDQWLFEVDPAIVPWEPGWPGPSQYVDA